VVILEDETDGPGLDSVPVLLQTMNNALATGDIRFDHHYLALDVGLLEVLSETPVEIDELSLGDV
jgi:hypothetical protein